MISLNLETKNNEQKRIKEYLENNVNEILADKINNGVSVTRDNKTLISKKDLNGCWEYCSKQAKEMLENKTSGGVYVSDDVVFGWAMHYFEEDTIEGNLYNPDGSEYKKPVPVTKPSTTTYTPPKQEPKPQMSMFDILTEKENNETQEPNEDVNDATEQEEIQPVIEEHISPLYQRYLDNEKEYPDKIVVMRVGDFYEVFGDNAVKLANELDLTLTGRDCGLTERVPMIGFPYHTMEQYFKKIINCGHKIALLDDTLKQEPKLKPVQQNIDVETGEILNSNVESDEILTSLFDLFRDEMEIRL